MDLGWAKSEYQRWAKSGYRKHGTFPTTSHLNKHILAISGDRQNGG